MIWLMQLLLFIDLATLFIFITFILKRVKRKTHVIKIKNKK